MSLLKLKPQNLIKLFSECDNKRLCSVLSIDPSYVDTFIKSGSKKLKIIFTVDVSGSMDEYLVGSSISKLCEIKVAILEILDFLTTLSVNGHNISATLIIFNSSAKVIFETHDLQKDCEEFVKIINSLFAVGNTNIDAALIETEKILSNIEHIVDSSVDANINMNSEILVFFLTDGFHTGGFHKNKLHTKKSDTEDEIQEIIKKFSTSKYRHLYYGIGLGTSNNYDSNMMSKLFGNNFFGCPLSKDASSAMISITVSGVSTFLSDVTISFSENIINQYTILSPLNFNENTKTYEIEKIGLSNKLPICFDLKNKDNENIQMFVHTSPIFATISGKYYDGHRFITTSFDVNFSDNIILTQNCDLYYKYFEFKDEFKQLVNNINEISKSNNTLCAIKMKNLLDRLNSVVLSNSHIMKSFYVDLKNQISSFYTDIESINVGQLDDNQLQEFFSIGKNRLAQLSSLSSQQTDSLTLSRQVSSQVGGGSKSIKMAIRQQSSPVKTTLPTYKLPVRNKRSNISLHTENLSQEYNKNFSFDFTQPMAKLAKTLESKSDESYQEIMLDGETVESEKCVICAENNINIIAIPCKHTYCQSCYKTSYDKCPFCRQHIDIATKIIVDSLQCSCCNMNKSCILFLPCMHVNVCKKCCREIKKCTKCNINIEKKILIYIQ